MLPEGVLRELGISSVTWYTWSSALCLVLPLGGLWTPVYIYIYIYIKGQIMKYDIYIYIYIYFMIWSFNVWGVRRKVIVANGSKDTSRVLLLKERWDYLHGPRSPFLSASKASETERKEWKKQRSKLRK